MVKFNEWQPGDPPLGIDEYHGWTNVEVFMIVVFALVLGIVIGAIGRIL